MDTPPAADMFPAALVRLLNTARQAVDEHVNDHGNCDDCGSVWPCERAQLAEFVLATL
jgi:hypothetical protein